MIQFSKIFFKLLHEEMTSGGGVFGAGSTQGGYAEGDARMPTFLGSRKVRMQKRKRKKRKKQPKLDMSKQAAFPQVQSRISGMSGPGGKAGFGAF